MGIDVAWVAAVILLGSFVQGLTGFGLALVSVPLLSLLLDAKLAVPVAGLYGWAVTFPLVWRMRAHVQWRTAFMMALASIPGSFLGVELLKRVPGAYLLILMGLVLVIASIRALRSKKDSPRGHTSRFQSAIAGFFSGTLGASVGEPGPPAIAYLSMQAWQPDQIKSTLLFFFMLQMIGAILGFWHKDLLTPKVWHLCAWAIPSFMIGLFLGMNAWNRLKNTKIDYPHAVHLFLLVIGAFLVLKNVYLLLRTNLL